jgi:hypothetical protein
MPENSEKTQRLTHKEAHEIRKVRHRKRAFGLKFLTMIVLSLGDLCLNALTDQMDENLFLTIAQPCIQIGIFTCFFLFLFDTYPFKVGIVKPLIKTYRFSLAIMIMYTAISTAHVLNRRKVSQDLDSQNDNFMVFQMWTDDSFYALAVIQKMFAIVYYVVAINIAYSFTEPMYFSEEYWVDYTKKRRGMA